MDGENKIYTIGHGRRSIEEFIKLLEEHGINRLIDVRTVPGSHRNPQFDREALSESLKREGLEYVHMKDMGGWRKADKDSPHTAWEDESFRGYADYMMTEKFEKALEVLKNLAAGKKTCVMCAETLPWKCHRLLLSDALLKDGFAVVHILGPGQLEIHSLTPFARMGEGKLIYRK